MNPFAEKYRTLTNEQLIEIIDTSENYQTEAVIGAEQELLARNLPVVALEDIRAENQLRQQAEAAKSDKIHAFENKIKDAGNSLIEMIQPSAVPTPVGRTIALVSIVFGGWGLFNMYHFVRDIIGLRAAPLNIMIRLTAPSFFEAVFLTLGAYLFWKRMKWGWIFLSFFLCFSILGAFIVFFAMIWKEFSRPYSDYSWKNYLASWAGAMIFLGLCIWFLCRRNVRAIYKIDRNLAIIIAAAGVFLALLVFMLMVT